MRTKVAILAEIQRHKTCSRAQLDRYLAAFNILPVGVRQRPRLYSEDAAERILKQLGLLEGPNGALVNPEHACGSPWPDKPERIVSMKELREERRKRARRAV